MNFNGRKFKKPTAAILIVLTLISGFYFFITLFSPDIVEKKTLSLEYVQSGRLDYSAELKPNLIYEREIISGNEVLYSALLKRMELFYFYRFHPTPEDVEVSYRIKILLSPTKGGWEKEIGTYNGNISKHVLELRIPLDWEMVNLMWKEIENETKYNFGDPNVRLVADLNVRGRISGQEINEKFIQSSNITYGKIISLSEPEKSKTGEIYSNTAQVNTMSLFGFPMEVRNARLIFGAEFLSLALVLGIFIFTNKSEIADYLSKRDKRSFERKFRNRIVNTLEFPEHSEAVRVLNLKDLARLSCELDKPILKADKRFAVVDGERVYIHDDDNIIIDRK